MNPVLLKPSGNMKTQVIVNGKVKCDIDSYKYKELNQELKEVVKDTYEKISKEYDLIILEGSGSCAEINLKESDIANMHMAKVSNSPVILVADIDRGGVFASVVGTIMLLDKEERNKVKGIIIKWGFPISCTLSTYLIETLSSLLKELKSVKLDI